jgi:uncharacterized protein GlcG (DUF336 family)
MAGPDLELARQMCVCAAERAGEAGALVSVAVVDSGGHLVAFERMDGAEIAGPTLATDKAYTAVAHRIATHELAPLTAPGGSLQGMHANGGGRYVTFAGGLPLWEDGRVVGGIGVSGGTAEQDLAIVTAVASLWQDG